MPPPLLLPPLLLLHASLGCSPVLLLLLPPLQVGRMGCRCIMGHRL
jgi:hypothetical protein